MLIQSWFLPLVMAVSIPGILTSPSKTKETTGSQPIVYTADKSREQPYPAYKSPTVGTTLDELYDETKTANSNQEPDNAGFVEPIDFNSFLTQVGSSNKKSDNLPIFGSESNNKDTFAGFFNTKEGNAFSEPSFAGISSAASNHKSQKSNGAEEESGFVDPNVQFRSLFDSSETARGFRPEDFLGSKEDSSGVDPSKGSQTRAFPSFTYTGRNGERDREGDHEQQANRFRSSYRQVDSRGRDRNDGNDRSDRNDRNDRNERNDRSEGNGRQSFDPYDDTNYYSGEYDDSPTSPPNPRNSGSYNNQRFSQRQGEPDDSQEKENYAPAVQESSHSPQGSSPKAAASGGGKGKCKKVQKDVEYEEDYRKAYTDPEPDYDPSTYGENDRYKRQAGRAGNDNKKNTRPMTCYVCEDEQGRYAERCEYDSKGDPKQGGYFHSSSTSYNDNGRRPRGGRGSGNSERYRRNPSLSAQVSTTTAASTSTAQSVNIPQTTENVSDRGKRQSNRGRDDSGEEDDRESQDNENDRGRDYDSTNNDNGDYDESRDDDYAPGSQRSPTTNRENNEDYGTRVPSSSPRSQSTENPRPQNQGNYGFAAPSPGNRGGREFDFGPPTDFGRDASSSESNNRGFNFDFSIPKEFDPDVQLGTSNTNNRPVFSGSNKNEFGLGNFDIGYEDYVKKYFPVAFGATEGSASTSGSGSTPGPAPASSSYRPNGAHSSSSSPSSRGHSPHKEHTQQSHSYAPPPYYQDDGGLEKLVGAFNQKDRNGCQKVNKGDMTCYVCRDSSGMNKEECMYASNDPNGKNTRMAYHESTEYSSPPVMILPHPRLHKPSPATTPNSPNQSKPEGQESKRHEKIKSPLDYDFDY